MDDTTQSRKSEAAATRKRRSSILKAGRQSRAPLSELEFNAPTPTTDTKGRRVSFSRRNNVAEFVTNEATTTWKNLYEEHNRTLESSGNESTERPRRQQLGARLVDQQFQEVISIDFDEGRAPNIDCSLSQVALTNLDRTTDERTPLPPQHKFELSTFTDHQSKLFADDIAISGMGELTDKISFNFSSMQPLKSDDLDQMENDLLNLSPSRGNVVCQGPNMGNVSEYIEVDLNMTRITTPNEQSDMSITDTIHSPKVQDVSKSTNSISNDKPGKDWVADKENIVLNPYVAPKESDNFAINEEPDKVLVFDGKRVTLQSDREPVTVENKDKIEEKKPQRKTIVLNVNDDLPNFVDDLTASRLPNCVENESLLQTPKGGLSSKTVDGNDLDFTSQLMNHMLDMTEPQYESGQRRACDVSETKTKPSDISMTQALPARIILADKTEKRKTIVYETDAGNISVTQPVPSTILAGAEPAAERRKTIVYEDEAGNVSITQAVPSHIFLPSETNKPQDKRRTIVFETDTGDISITQAVPSNLIMPENKIVYDSDSGDISVTKALPNDLILRASPTRRQTILYANETGNLSTTQAIRNNIFIEHAQHEERTEPKRRETIVFENDMADMSATQAIDQNLILCELPEEPVSSEDYIGICESSSSNTQIEAHEKRKTIVFETDAADVSMTQAIPSNILTELIDSQKRKTIVFENDAADISMTKPIGPNVILESCEQSEITLADPKFDPNMDASKENMNLPQKVINDHEDNANMSITEVISTKPGILSNQNERRMTLLYDNGDIELTEAIPANILIPQVQTLEQSVTETPITTSAESINTKTCGKRYSDDGDVSMTQESDESKSMIKISASTLGNHSTLDAQFAAKESSHYSISDKKKEILENCLKMVSLTKNVLRTSPTNPPPRNIIETMVYQTETGNIPSLNPKAIEFNASKIDELREKSSNITSPSKDIVRSTEVKNELEHIEKADSDSISVVPMTSCETVSTDISKIQHDLKKALLSDLLDMSNASVDIGGDGYDDKSVTAKIESAILSIAPAESTKSPKGATSVESFFFIKEEDDGVQTENSDEDKDIKPKLEVRLPLQIEFKRPENEEVMTFEKPSPRPEPPITVKRSPPSNRYFEKIRSPDLGSSLKLRKRNVKEADNTKELLEMLADFTDREEEENPVQPLRVKGQLTIEHKADVPDERMNVSRRRSVVPSREEMLNNISLAQSMLQKSQMVDESTLVDETYDTTLEQRPSPKAVQVPGDVVKTLRFEEESVSEYSVKYEVLSPLKKTAFGETSYMKENKTNVIPSYLKDVSDGLKQLMSDLVKPMADTVPFTGDKPDGNREPSTCSMQVEANLITSSQIDIDVDARSDENESTGSRGVRKGIIKPSTPTGRRASISPPKSPPSSKRASFDKPVDQTFPQVIVFDQNNPLNNVLLAPIDFSTAHSYQPRSQDSLSRQSSQVKFQEEGGPDVAADRVSTQYNVETCVTQFSNIPGGDASAESISQVHSKGSVLSKRASVDVEVDAHTSTLKSSEANTVIAMKGNKQLLQESSSLTLVDENEVDEVHSDSQSSSGENNSPQQKQSPVEVLYCTDISPNLMESDALSSADLEILQEAKTKKRPYSPTPTKQKHRNPAISKIDTTPKQNNKIRKVSKSPNDTKARPASGHAERKSKSPNESPTGSLGPASTEKRKTVPPSPKISPKKKGTVNSNRPGTQVTVQQLIAEYHIAAGVDTIANSAAVLEVLKKQSNLSSSTERVFSGLKPTVETSSLASLSTSAPCSESAMLRHEPSPMDWQPELINEVSSKNLVAERESDVDVLANIETLPFMGSGECSWEAMEGHSWSFLVLRGRLRLALQLAATPLRNTTPIQHVAVENTTHETDAIAVLCVRFASEAMRHACSRASCAGDVPVLLRRCAGVGRVAARWATALHAARLRLALDVQRDGTVTMKVANIPLRSVWEVSLQLVMSCEGRDAPCPRAARVRVDAVLGGRGHVDKDIARAVTLVPSDWGHAPRAIWTIFKYLKNKTTDDVINVL